MILALTGHRPDKLGGYDPCALHEWLRAQLRAVFEIQRPTEVITGMALGWDTFGAEVAVTMGIPFCAAIPFEGQERKWPADSQRRYRVLLARAARVKIVSEHYYKGVFQARNVWMVDQLKASDDALYVCHDGSAGGTLNCLKYAFLSARTTGMPKILRLDPGDYFKGLPR